MVAHTPVAAGGDRTATARRRSGVGRQVVRLAILVAILAVVLYPLIWMIGTSFKSQEEIVNNIGLIPRRFTPGNFTEGWNNFDVSFGRFFLNSAMVSLLTVVGNMVSCLLAAYAFARLRFRLRRFWFAIMIGTLLLPGHVLTVPQYILFRKLDMVGGPWPYLPLVLPQFLATEAFFVFLMVQFMRGIPRELDEAAKIDGANAYGIFRYVILPLSRPALVTTAIFSFIWTWNEFFRQLVYISDLDAYTVPVALTLFIDSTSQSAVGPMFAMSLLSLLPVFLFFVAFQRMLVEGINTSGLKG
ncbi:carbohydrate ABC transporter permease [Micromonospora sp. HM5-17]|jgi:multiple sugar transport system permease protein|uniref:carbohydrate ABC transporter permease n=1 Tax=Micromonospora sp. HM5-17 TaxID=2487710 RepID=UPI000F4994EF|nr:carbohydrate ABC transporter permease [Micromonospora sp. HM5-17]ROT28089.1 carbohydrate ABC transporter permease [Micromonospora sp. HM5-17]